MIPPTHIELAIHRTLLLETFNTITGFSCWVTMNNNATGDSDIWWFVTGYTIAGHSPDFFQID